MNFVKSAAKSWLAFAMVVVMETHSSLGDMTLVLTLLAVAHAWKAETVSAVGWTKALIYKITISDISS